MVLCFYLYFLSLVEYSSQGEENSSASENEQDEEEEEPIDVSFIALN